VVPLSANEPWIEEVRPTATWLCPNRISLTR